MPESMSAAVSRSVSESEKLEVPEHLVKLQQVWVTMRSIE